MKKAVLVSNLASLMMLASLAPASAQVCGDTLGPGGTVTLTADIGPCNSPGSPSLTIVGPIKVDLAGHQIQCDSMNPSNGIVLSGTAASVTGGSVRGCAGTSVTVGGTGKHSLSSIAVKGGADNGIGVEVLTGSNINKLTDVAVVNGGSGFVINGDKNKLTNLMVTNADDAGVTLGGTGNKVTRLAAINATKEGIIVSGSGNKIADCESASAGNEGITLFGNNNSLKDCTSTLSVGHGFQILGASNSISASDASNNDTRGFNVAATGTRISGSTAVNNGGDGFVLAVGPSTLSDARAISNGGNGIQVDSGSGHVVTRSVALESGGTNDVRDNTACAAGTWTDNVFRSSNDACIQ